MSLLEPGVHKVTLQGMALFKPFTIDPIASETSGLGLTAIELPVDAVFYDIALDK